MIFACENNLYATHMPVKACRVKNNIYKIAEPFLIESHEIDGNDVLQVYEAGQKAVEECRKGEGPVFLEFLTYRFRGHVGPDDNIQGTHTDIRPKQEVEEWRKKDPIIRFEKYLLENNVLSSDELEEIRKEVEKAVEEAHLFAKNSPYPHESELEKYVFG